MPSLCNVTLTGVLSESVMNQTNTSMSNFIFASNFTNFTSMEELCIVHSDFRHTTGKQIAILRSTSAIVSIIASSILIWMIRRSHKGLSDTYHRLLLGLSIADITFSASQAFFNIMAPYEVNYVVWNARGNMYTCSMQGFIRLLGGMCGQGYNCSLNLFFLAAVNAGKKEVDDKVKKQLHVVPIMVALTICIISVSTKSLNVDEYGNCWDPVYDPPHCKMYEKGTKETPDYWDFDIPCNRGREGGVFTWICILLYTYVPSIIVFTSLGLIYKKTLKQETATKRYDFRQQIQNRDSRGSGGSEFWLQRSMRRFSSMYLKPLRASNISSNAADMNMRSSSAEKINRSSDVRLPAVAGNNRSSDIMSSPNKSSATGNNRASIMGPSSAIEASVVGHNRRASMMASTVVSNSSKQDQKRNTGSRAVMAKAVAYSIAFLLTWSGGIVIEIYEIQGKDTPVPFYYFAAIFMPLQGLYNWLIFMYPKVSIAKNGTSNQTWIKAFKIAFWSRGRSPHKRNLQSRRNQEVENREIQPPSGHRRASMFRPPTATATNATQSTSKKSSRLSALGGESIQSLRTVSKGGSMNNSISLNAVSASSVSGSNLSRSLSAKSNLSGSLRAKSNLTKSLSAKSTTAVTFNLQDPQPANGRPITNDARDSHNGDIESNCPLQVLKDEPVDEESINQHNIHEPFPVGQRSFCGGDGEEFLPAMIEEEVQQSNEEEDNDLEQPVAPDNVSPTKSISGSLRNNEEESAL